MYSLAAYDWFEALSHQGVWFVTRMKDNADFVVLEDRPVPAGKNVRSDLVKPVQIRLIWTAVKNYICVYAYNLSCV